MLLNCSVGGAMLQLVDMLERHVLQNWTVGIESQTLPFNTLKQLEENNKFVPYLSG
jgi:hypothetical protein